MRGGEWRRVDFDEALLLPASDADGLRRLDEAIARLEASDARKGRLAELRLFGGLSNEQAAAVLGVSPRTVVRDWRFVKAWLARELLDRAM